MELISVTLKGFFLGILISLPIGSTATLCLKRIMERGIRAGFMTGLGAALADAIYACIGAFGLTVVADFLISIEFWIRLLGGLMLVYIGVKSQLKPHTLHSFHKENLKKGDFFSTFFLTLTNPMTLFAFIALFAGIGVKELEANYLLASFLVLGVFLGALLSWGSFSWLIGFYREKMTAKTFFIIHKIAAIILCIFGLVAIFSAYFIK